MKMRKLVAALLAVLMLCSIIPFSVAAESASATITFDDAGKRTEFDADHQVWQENGITVTNNKDASATGVADYAKPARFYKGSTLIVEYPGMTKIEFACNTAAYATALAGVIDGATADGKVVSVTLNGVDSFSCSLSGGQVRMDALTVYSGEGGETPVDPDVPGDDPVDPPVDPDVPGDEPVDPAASATITFDDAGKRTEFDADHQVWQENGITVINNKDASTTGVADYAKPARFYKGSTLIVEYPGMTKIEFACNTAAYATALAGVIDGATADGKVVSVTLNGVDSFSCSLSGGQVRMDSLTVYSGEGGETPDIPDQPAIPDGIELSIADAIAMGQTYEHNIFSEAKYYVTGVITEVYNTQFGNMRVTDEAGNILTIYGTYNEDGSVRYDAMEEKPVAGDTVVLYGVIGQYNGTSQMKNGWIMGVIPGEGGDDPVDPPVSDDLGVIADPEVGVAYKFGMVQENVSVSDVYYLIGGMNSFYMATGTDAAAALDVYLEAANGGYYLYAMVNGVKQYINMVVSADGAHVNGAYEAKASTVYTYDADYQTVIADVDGAYYWFGTRNDKQYTTVGPCNIEYNGFYCQFYAEGGDTPVDPDQPGDDPVDPPVSGEIETDYPFLFGMIQYNVSEDDVYFLAGGMNGFYMETTTDADAAIVVYVEAADGGYYLYTYDGNQKLYINMVVNGTHVNGAYETKASTVYRYDDNYGTLIANVNGADYWFGTRNDNTYTTVGPCKVEYEGFYCELWYFTEEEDCEHEYDDEYDADCNLCGAIREVPDKPIETDSDFVVGNVEGSAGDTVQVTVSAINNPGIISAKVRVYFDTTVLKLVGAEAGNFSAGGYSWGDEDIANEEGSFVINWCDATHPDSAADLLATLSFEILEGTADGTYPITIEFSCDDDVFNAEDETVWFNAVDGSVTVVTATSIPGDVDGNGKLNNRDLGLMQLRLNDGDLTDKTFIEEAADMDGNGKLNNRDLGLLQIELNS